MGQVILRGENVGEKLETLCPQAYATLKEGKARYGFFTNEDGGIMDDLIVSNAGDHYFRRGQRRPAPPGHPAYGRPTWTASK